MTAKAKDGCAPENGMFKCLSRTWMSGHSQAETSGRMCGCSTVRVADLPGQSVLEVSFSWDCSLRGSVEFVRVLGGGSIGACEVASVYLVSFYSPFPGQRCGPLLRGREMAKVGRESKKSSYLLFLATTLKW